MKPSLSPSTYRLLAGLAFFLIAQSPLLVSAGYTLVWQDEFNQTDGTLPDTSKWGYDRGGWGWGNDEEQFYTNPLSPDFDTPNATIENNQLVIEVRDDSGLDGSSNVYFGNNYTSARLLTQGKFEHAYGRIEARIKVPDGGAGIWPAFWSLGATFDGTNWPNCGEIDFMEYVSRIPNEIFGTIHGPGYSGGASYGNLYDFSAPVATDYHVYAIEWEVDQIRWYVDGILYHTATPADVPGPWVYNQDFFLILNVAMGGNFGGPIDRSNINFPIQMLVDYVRVYEQTATNPQLLLTKTGTLEDSNENTLVDADGDKILYTFTIQNTGDLPLTNITVTDPLVTFYDTPVASPNLLTNEGFEAAIGAEWTQVLSGGTAGNSTTYARTGANSLLIDSTGAGDWSSPNLYQTFPANPGNEFNLQGWMLAPPAGIPGDSFGLLKIEFTDAGGTALDPASVSIGGRAAAPYFGAESTPFLNSGSATETWIFTETQAVAPANTAFVRFVVLNVNQPLNPGPMYFDDILATDVNAGDPPINLLPGESDTTTFKAYYDLTEADINAGKVVNTATANSNESVTDTDVEITLLDANLDLDTDGDSFINLFERAYGLDIFNADSLTNGPAESLMEITSQKYVSLTYRRLKGGSGTTGVSYSADGYNYVVETSSTMDSGSWESGAAFVEAVGSPIDNGDTTETVRVRSLAPMVPGSKVFIRLNVTKTP